MSPSPPRDPSETSGSGPSLPSACAEIRANFTAWESDELRPAERRSFDEHLSACRACSRALAEYEYVSLRLRQSFAWVEPSADFTHRVMDQVRKDAALEDLQSPEPGFTARLRDRLSLLGEAERAVPAQGRSELGRSELGRSELGRPEPEALEAAELPSGRRRPRYQRRLALLLSAAAMLLAGFLLFARGTPDPQELGRSEAAWSYAFAEPGDRLSLSGGEVPLMAPSELSLPAAVQWLGRSMVLQGPFQVELSGQGRAELLGKSKLQLQQGSLVLRSEKERQLSCALGSAFSLESFAGDLAVLVETVHAPEQDGFLLEVPLQRVSLRVLAGHAVVRSPEAEAPLRLELGEILLAEPLQPLRVLERQEPRGLAPADMARGDSSGGALLVRGFVRSLDQGPLPGATIELQVGGRKLQAKSDQRGAYQLQMPLPSRVDAPGLLVAAAEGLRPELRTARALLGQVQGPETLRRDLVLSPSRALQVRLVSSESVPIAAAQATLLRRDVLLGRVTRLAEAESRADGRFELPDLPDLEEGEELALLIEGKGQPLFVAYELEPDAATGVLELRAPELREVSVPLQDPASRVAWIERRPRGPLARFVMRLERHELAAGQHEFRLLAARGQEFAQWEDAGSGAPSRLQLRGVDFEGRRTVALSRERLRVVGTQSGPLMAKRYRLVRRVDGAVIAEGTVGANGALDLDLPTSRSELALALEGVDGWVFHELPAGGIAARYRIGDAGPAQPSLDPRLVAQQRLATGSGEGRYGQAPDIFEQRGRGRVSGLRRLELQLGEGGVSVRGVKLFARIGNGAPFLAGWSDYDGRIVLPSLPATGTLDLLAIDSEGGALRAGRERLQLRDVETGVYALDLAPVRAGLRGEFRGESLHSLAFPAVVEAELLDGGFRGMRLRAAVDISGQFRLPLVPQGRLQIRLAGSDLRREFGPRARVLRFE